MSRSNWETQELIDAASRYEALPSRQRMQGVRRAVLQRALIGGVVTAAGSTSLLAKAAALGATTVGNIAMFAAMGAVAGGVVVGVSANRTRPADTGSADVVHPARAAASSYPAESHPVATLPAPSSASPPPILAAPETTNEPPTPFPALRAAPTAPTPDSPPLDVTQTLDVAPRGGPKSADTLPQQLDVLRRMRSDLSERRAAQALSLYRENEILFRAAPLEPEARAAYISALCQLGRDQDAKREAARLLAAFPSSHLAQVLATGCAGAPPH